MALIPSCLIAAAIVCPPAGRSAAVPGNLLANPGFEERFTRTSKWEYFAGVSEQGTAIRSRDWSRDGSWSLKLSPNKTNTSTWLPYDFAIVQKLDAVKLRGSPLFFGGWMRATGGATAYLRVLAARKNGELTYREVQTSSPDPVYWRDVMDVPNEDLETLIFECAVKGSSGHAYFDEVALSPQMASTVRVGQADPGPPLDAQIAVDASTVVREIPSTLYGMNLEWVFNGHTIWDAFQGKLNDRLIQLASDLGVRMWRYPGGVFANHYHWRNGIGPQETRPISPTEPGADSSLNGFGTDEALEFGALTGGVDMMFTINANTGTPEEAAEWVRYVNNGTRYVKYWEIGNELYLRLADAGGNPKVITPEEYAGMINEFAAAMKAVDPTIKIGADTEFHYPFEGCARVGDAGCWTDVILRVAADNIDFFSVHNGFSPIGLAPLGGGDVGLDVRTVYAGMLAYPKLLAELMQGLGKRVEEIAPHRASEITIGATEWGPLFEIGPHSRLVDHGKTIGAALFVSSVFNVLIRDPRIEQATAFKLVDNVVHGWIGPRNGVWTPKPAYNAFQLYGRHALPLLVESRTFSPTYDSRSVIGVPAIKDVPFLDVIATANEDRSSVTLLVTNKHFDRAIRTSIALRGFSSNEAATAWTLGGTGLDANTGTDLPPGFVAQASASPDGRFDLGGPGEVWVRSENHLLSGSCLTFEFPPHSVTALVLKGSSAPGQNVVECFNVYEEPDPYKP